MKLEAASSLIKRLVAAVRRAGTAIRHTTHAKLAPHVPLAEHVSPDRFETWMDALDNGVGDGWRPAVITQTIPPEHMQFVRKWLSQLRCCDELHICLEPSSGYVSEAVRVETLHGQTLGQLEPKESLDVSSAMQLGIRWICIFKSMQEVSPSHIRIDVAILPCNASYAEDLSTRHQIQGSNKIAA